VVTVASDTLLAQGSTGGTLGKTDQSISGGVKVPDKAPTPKGIPGNKATAFTNPTIKGIPVDRCWHFGTECDEPAATAWCRSKGFKRATNWKWEYRQNTIGQSDGRQCPIPGTCGGFVQIVCE
jgi:hypothetical protein